MFFDGQKIHEIFHNITTATLRTICRRHIQEATVKVNARTGMYFMISQQSPSIQGLIRKTGLEATQMGKQRYSRQSIPGEFTQGDPRDNETVAQSHDEEWQPKETFMKAPSKTVIESIIGEFIDRTSNAALAVGVCAVCAREANKSELTVHRIDCIPNPQQLQPVAVHPHHNLINGMLLQPAGLTSNGGATVCVECLRALNSDRLPPFALANGMWVGEVPHELAFLTLPERLLIAKYFPSAYIIKLYPKKKGARHWDKSQMYSGLKGNVSTYQLDQKQIASMVDGAIMPHQSKVLAATIGITFVGPKNLPDKGLPDLFKVRRNRVQKALEWLRDNNPLFSNITISASRLSELPENDVPYELLATTKLSSDTSALYAEHDGYVPSQDAEDADDADGDGGENCLLFTSQAYMNIYMNPMAESNESDSEGGRVTSSDYFKKPLTLLLEQMAMRI